MTPRILALDLSLTQTGYAFEASKTITGYEDDIMLSGVIRSRLKGWGRVNDIRREVMQFSSVADVVVIEGYSFGSQGRAVYQIAELGGVIRYSLWMRKVPYVEVPPSTLKKWATGKGNVGKDEMIAAAIRKHGFEGSNNNAADAHLLWHMANAYYSGKYRTKIEAEQCQKVSWPEIGETP